MFVDEGCRFHVEKLFLRGKEVTLLPISLLKRLGNTGFGILVFLINSGLIRMVASGVMWFKNTVIGTR